MSYGMQKRGSYDLAESNDKNKNIIEHAVEAMQLGAVDFNDPKAVLNRINLYFNRCGERGIKPSPVGMLNYLQVPASVIKAVRNGRPIDVADQRVARAIDAAMACLEQITNDAMMNDGANPVASIFQSKAWFGYTDQPQKQSDRIEKAIDKDELLKEAQMLPDPVEIEQ